MPLVAFSKSGTCNVVTFDGKTGAYTEVKKHVTPGDVHEVTLKELPKVVKMKIGVSADQLKFNKRQKLLKKDRDSILRIKEARGKLPAGMAKELEQIEAQIVDATE